jgi:hypothetical protein
MDSVAEEGREVGFQSRRERFGEDLRLQVGGWLLGVDAV